MRFLSLLLIISLALCAGCCKDKEVCRQCVSDGTERAFCKTEKEWDDASFYVDFNGGTDPNHYGLEVQPQGYHLWRCPID